MGNDEKMHLAAAIQYDMEEIGATTIEELAGYNRIIVKAPTGSGKNYFCMHVLPKMASGRILFITSREATVEQFGRELQEKADKEGFAPSVRFCRIGEPPQDRNFFYGHSWDIEQYLAEYVERAKQGFFRYIIMDECHSLTTDSTFASAPLAALEVLEAAAPDTVVILMSACPERIYESEFAAEYIRLDYSDCHKAGPQHVEIIQGTTAKALCLKAGEDNKILYYVVSTKHAYELEKKSNEAGIRATAITSQPDERKKIYKEETELEEKRRGESGLILEYLKSNERFPDNVDLIISTTKLREGINVKDRRVKTVITELRDSVSLIQCAGRVRHGVENFYIIEGNRFCLESEYQERYKSGKKQIDNHNRTLWDYDNQNDKDNFITSVEKLHKGVLYYSKERDCFVLNRFYMPEQEQKWADWEEWKTDKAGYVRRVMEREQVTYEVEEDKLIEIIEPYCGRRLDKAERAELLDKLNAVLPLNKQVAKKINTILEKVGYTCKMGTDKRHYWIERKAKT